MRMRMMILGTFTAIGGLACTGSEAGGVGAPCNVDEDCEGELICDEHDGQSSCQLPHGHDDDDAGDDEPETGVPSHEHGSHEHGSSEHGSGSGSSSSSSGGASAECASFCGCMTDNCAGFDAYPFEDEAGCMTYCAGLDATQSACFFGFCETAATEPSEALREHWCEHAWGQLGEDEC